MVLTAGPVCSVVGSTHTGRSDGHKAHHAGWVAYAGFPQGHWL